MTRILELRTDARLIFAHFIERQPQSSHCLFVLQQFLNRQTRLLHLIIDLQNGQVVGLAKQERHGFEELCIDLAHLDVFTDCICHSQRIGQLFGLIGAEGHMLQPHHCTEVATQRVVAGVVATRTEERVAKFHITIVEEIGISIL